MSWVRYESGFVRHDKVQRIPDQLRPAAIAIHQAATGYCAELLTDGLVPKAILPVLANVVGVKRHRKALESLHETRLFLTANTTEIERYNAKFDARLEPDERSLLVNDYLQYNPSAADVEVERKRAAERQKQKRDRDRQQRIDMDVTGRSHSVTSQAKSQQQSQRSHAGAPARDPVPSLESVSSQREEGLTREPSDNGLTPAAGSTRNGQPTAAFNRARAFVERVGREYPSWPVLADELYATTALGKPHFPDLTDDDLLELRELHAALLDPEPTTLP